MVVILQSAPISDDNTLAKLCFSADSKLSGKCPLLTPEGLDLIAPLGTDGATMPTFPLTDKARLTARANKH